MIECPKYSVIIPVYNAASTLRRCVDSLLDQDYADAELILVNDGSTDDSGEICRRYAEGSDRIVYIEKENGGVSTARNAGLDAARGTYVLFVDSDDYVSERYFLTLDRLCERKDYDCVLFSHTVVRGDAVSHSQRHDFCADDMEAAVAKFCEAYYRKHLTPPWNKRYVRRIIEDHHIRFPVHLYVGEDKVFSLQYATCCKSFMISSERLYVLSLENENSLSRKVRPDLHRQLAMKNVEIGRIIQNADLPEAYRQKYVAAENLTQLRAIYSESKRMHLMSMDAGSRRRAIRQMCRKNNSQKAEMPCDTFSRLLQIPVRLQMVSVIDLFGRYLSGK